MEVRTQARMRRWAGMALCAMVLGVPTAVAAADPEPVTAPPTPAAPGCDPNYAGGCVPQGAPAVSCADLGSTTDLLVVGEDVYDLDQGGAGRVACEASGADVPVAVTAAVPLTPEPVAAAPVPAEVAGAQAAVPELALTGSTTAPLLAVALVLLSFGGALVLLTRPRPELLWHGAVRRGDVRFTVESLER